MIKSFINYFRLLKIANTFRNTERYQDLLAEQEANKEAIHKAHKALRSRKATFAIGNVHEDAQFDLQDAEEERKEILVRVERVNEYIDSKPDLSNAMRKAYPKKKNLQQMLLSNLAAHIMLFVSVQDFHLWQMISMQIILQTGFILSYYFFFKPFGKINML